MNERPEFFIGYYNEPPPMGDLALLQVLHACLQSFVMMNAPLIQAVYRKSPNLRLGARLELDDTHTLVVRVNFEAVECEVNN